MAYALTPALYIAIILCIVSAPVLLLLILLHLRKSAKRDSEGLDTAFRLFGMGKQARKELREEEREIESVKGIGREILHELREFTREFREFTGLLRQFLFPAAKGFKISQIIGGTMQADIKGIVVGQVGTFTGVPDPPGSALQAGNVPNWSADDPNVALTPAADGSSVAAQTSATDTATSFNLTQSGVNSAGAAISTTVNVPLLPVTPPPPVPATGFNISQVS